MKYTSRSMRRRGKGDQWEVTLSHKDPLTGEVVRTYHVVVAKTEKQACKARDELILELERKGGAVGTNLTVRDFMQAFRLFKQALNWAKAQDLITKNPCDFCKPPKRVKTPINALNKEDRSRLLALARKAQPEPLGLAIELALTTGMRRGEVCALRLSDLNDDGTITVSHALGNGPGGFYLKEPKTGSSARTIPLTNSIYGILSHIKKAAIQQSLEFKIPLGDPFILGTLEPDSRPYNPTQLGKDFGAFCRMNGFDCTFHDLRHTFATMMIANGCDVRTVASYLGHASVSMTLDIYADVDPDAKMAALNKVEESFDFEGKYLKDAMEWHAEPVAPERAAETPAIAFTEEQLLAMLEEVRSKKSKGGAAVCA